MLVKPDPKLDQMCKRFNISIPPAPRQAGFGFKLTEPFPVYEPYGADVEARFKKRLEKSLEEMENNQE